MVPALKKAKERRTVESIRISRVVNDGRYGISRGNGSGNMMLGPGIADPLCGWDWLLNRAHPQVELSFSLNMGGSRFSATLKPGQTNAHIVKDLSRAAFARG